MKFKKLLPLFLALLLILGALIPAIGNLTKNASIPTTDNLAENTSIPATDNLPENSSILAPEDYKIYHQMGVGDAVNLSTFSLDTPEAIDEYLDVLEDLGYKRIYWRGLEQAIMTDQFVLRPEGNVRVLFRALQGHSMYWETANYGTDENGNPLTIDQYLVREAHKRGIEVIGQCKWADYGGFGDSTYGSFPFAYYTYHKEHPEWVPVDQWGMMTQAGAVEFAYPEARKYVVDMIMEEVEKAGYDGVLFIGYTENYDLKFEDQFGYSEPAVTEFKRRYGKTPELDGLSYNVSLEQWRMLRGEYLTLFLQEMKTALTDYSARTNNGDILGVTINSSKSRQPQIWYQYYDSMITGNAYLDFETYVQEGIVDEFHVWGNTAFDKQTKLIDDLIWLCRGTESEVIIASSVVDHTNYGSGFLWEPYLQQGVGLHNYYTLGTSDSYGNTIASDHSMYKVAPDISDQIGNMSEESQLRYHVAQVANGYEQATFEELEEWILGDGVIVPRMAMNALVLFHRDDPRAPALLEKALNTSDQIGVRALALRYIGLYDYTTPTMLDSILANIDDDSAWGTAECGKLALQHMNKDALWTAFTDPNSSLRAKILILEALNGTILTEAQIDYLHNNVVLGLRTNYDDIYSDDPDMVLEASYKNVLRWYSVALTYHAIRGGRANAMQNMLDYAASDDTVIAVAACDYIGDCVVNGLDVPKEWVEDAVKILTQRFADLSSQSGVDYGDSDWREWAYRPIGRSLLNLGDEGKAAMEEFYSGSDPELAVYAFKCMYLPVDEHHTVYMTYDAYKEAYSHLPRVFNSYKIVKIEQDFEDSSLFHAASTGIFGDASTTDGRWGFGNNPSVVTISNDHARSGNRSLLLTGNMSGSDGVTVYNAIPVAGKDYRISLWIYHDGGKFNISTAASGTANSQGQVNMFSDPSGTEVFVQIDENGRVWFYDYVNGESATFIDTGLTIEKNKMTQITIDAMRAHGWNKATVSVRPLGGQTQTSERFSIVPHDDVMVLRMTHQNTGGTYVDDVQWLLAELNMTDFNK